MYSGSGSWVLAFHGCDKAVGENILAGHSHLSPSQNSYDWLGTGIYFWENDEQRAQEYAAWLATRTKHPAIKEPFVIGAIIEIGNCLDLLQRKNIELLRSAYGKLIDFCAADGHSLPTNKMVSPGGGTLLRDLDCAVINFCHKMRTESRQSPFETVRAAFWEGEELYPGAGFRAQNHVQLCVRNPNCIKGYFRPLKRIAGHPLPG